MENPLADQAAVEDEALPEEERVFYQLSFAADEEFMQKFREAQAVLLGGSKGSPSVQEVFSQALDLLLEKRSPKRRNAIRERRELTIKGKNSDAGVVGNSTKQNENKTLTRRDKDWVLKEAGYQCSYVSPGGVRCKETRGLQVDHIIPRVVGGGNDRTNLRCLCQAHNLLEAELALGRSNVRRRFESAAQGT